MFYSENDDLMSAKLLPQLLEEYAQLAGRPSAHDLFKEIITTHRGAGYTKADIAAIVAGTRRLTPPSIIRLGEIIGQFPDDLLRYMGVRVRDMPAIREILESLSEQGQSGVERPVGWLASQLYEGGHIPHLTSIYGWFTGRSFPTENARNGLAAVLGIDESLLERAPSPSGINALRPLRLPETVRDLPHMADFERKFGDPCSVAFLDTIEAEMAKAPGHNRSREAIARQLCSTQHFSWALSVTFAAILGYTPNWAIKEDARFGAASKLLIDKISKSDFAPRDEHLVNWLMRIFTVNGKAPLKASISQWMIGETRLPKHHVVALMNELRLDEGFVTSYEVLGQRLIEPKLRNNQARSKKIIMPRFTPSDEQRRDLEETILPLEDPNFLSSLEGMMEYGVGAIPLTRDIIRSLTHPCTMRWDLIIQYHLIFGRIPVWARPEGAQYIAVPPLLMDAFTMSTAVPSDQPLIEWFDREVNKRKASAPSAALRLWLTGHKLPRRTTIDLIASILRLSGPQHDALIAARKKDHIPPGGIEMRGKAKASDVIPTAGTSGRKAKKGAPRPRADHPLPPSEFDLLRVKLPFDPNLRIPNEHRNAPTFSLRVRAALKHRKLISELHAPFNEVEAALRYLMHPRFKLHQFDNGNFEQPNVEDTVLIAKRTGVDPVWLILGTS